MGKTYARLNWLIRRLSRVYWQEIPYRAAAVVRSMAQSWRLFDASRVPRTDSDARWGRSWCRVPSHVGATEDLRQTSQEILSGTLEVFGRPVQMHAGIPDWNADPVTGFRLPTKFGLFIDFRLIGDGIDVKHLWEVNRHLWWMPLAQHYALTGDRQCLERLGELLSSWMDQCPYALGPNWSSPVEHGVRLINWSAIWHLVGGAESALFEGSAGQALLQRWLASIYQHIRFASDNYSLYSSSDNHLIGEAAGVFVAGHTWDRWHDIRHLRNKAKQILEEEMLKQFSIDGVNLEQAFCYQKFSLQFMLAAGLAARVNNDDFSAAFWSRMEAGVVFLASMMDCRGKVPAVGDSDDGDVWSFNQEKKRNAYRSVVAIGGALFNRAELQQKSASASVEPDTEVQWLSLGRCNLDVQPGSMALLPTVFKFGGYVVLGHRLHASDEFRVLFDCGALGYNRIAGHGHADALSVLVGVQGEWLLTDPGTYCYNAAPQLRHYFRGTAAHNTAVIDRSDQSEYGASFLWLRDVNTSIVNSSVTDDGKTVHACHDGYTRLRDPVVHHRRVTLAARASSLIVEDWIECREAHDVDLYWHAGVGVRIVREGVSVWSVQGRTAALRLSSEAPSMLAAVIRGQESPAQGWVSTRFYERTPADVLVSHIRLQPRQIVRTVIQRVDAGDRSEARR